MAPLPLAGSRFLEHLHFGLDALTCLLQHCTGTANSPLMAQVLLLLSGTAHVV
jgi:hypothetical protein